jgi:hypothetical protein
VDESDRFKDLEVRDIRLSAVPGLIGCGGCGVLLLKRTAEDLSEMGLTLKLGTRKKLLSFLQNLGKSISILDSVTQALQLPTSTSTQDGPAATTPTKVYVPAASASSGVYESAATPTAEACNMQQLCYISINWSLSACRIYTN